MGIPEIQIYSELPSTQDEAFALAQNGALPPWGSVLSAFQTNGRGQARKKWQGMRGNLMASMRLPETAPFTEQAAAIAVSTLIGAALKNLGYAVNLKWPNDLGKMVEGIFCKFAGILVEEKNGVIIAGVGINLSEAPAQHILDVENAAPPCSLNPSGNFIEPVAFWKELLALMLKIYATPHDFLNNWNNLANTLLIWKGKTIIFDESGKGTLEKIAPDGSLIIKTDKGNFKITSGSIRLLQK